MGLYILWHLSSVEQAADILTKGLSKLQHGYLVSKLGTKNIFIPPSSKGGILHMEKMDDELSCPSGYSLYRCHRVSV